MKFIQLPSMILFTLLGAGTLAHARSMPPKQVVTQAQVPLRKTLVVGITIVDAKIPAIPFVNALMMRRQSASEKWYDFLMRKRQASLTLPARDAQVVRVSSGGTIYVPTSPTYDSGLFSTYLLLHGPFSWTQHFPGNYAVFGFVSIQSRLNANGSVSMVVQVQEHKRSPEGELFPPGDWQQATMKGAWRLKTGETVQLGMIKERNNTEHIIYATIVLIKPNSDNSPTSG